MEITVPATGMRLAQAVGRLLRTDQNYGAVSILDRRQVTSHWGAVALARPVAFPLESIGGSCAVGRARSKDLTRRLHARSSDASFIASDWSLDMTNALVTINGARPGLPTVLGQGPIRIPTGGKIRAGIKVLTKKAAEHPKAKEIYERGVANNDSFEVIERAISAAVPELKTPLIPRTCRGSRCGRTILRIRRSPRRFWRRTAKTAAMARGGSTGFRSCFRPTCGRR